MENSHLLDIVSIDYAFFGERDQTAKPVLVMREHKCRWTESLPMLRKGGQDQWVVKSVADMIRRTGLRRFIFKSGQEPAVS